MANKELANQWKHGCVHGMYAWNDLGTPTSVTGSHIQVPRRLFLQKCSFSSQGWMKKEIARSRSIR